MHFFPIRFLLIAISSASLTVDNSGELVMIRETKYDKILLTCTSEDDRAALVWNGDLQQNSCNKSFSTIWPRHDPECAIVAPNECITKWEPSNGWKLVNSVEHPMGPVFDSRWEEFEEHSFSRNFWSYGYVDRVNVKNLQRIAFSVRGEGNIEVKLCKKNNKELNSCCWIWIDEALTPEFEKKTCFNTGILPEYSKTGPDIDVRCSSSKQHDSEFKLYYFSQQRQPLVAKSEWQTFSLGENMNTADRSERGTTIAAARFEDHIEAQYLYVGSLSPGKVRFHNYTYLLAMKEGSKLSTSEFNQPEKSICIELLVSLCSVCELIVQIVDSRGYTQTIGTIPGNESQSTPSHWPTWKVSKLEATLSEVYVNPVKLQILSILKQKSSDARWAIDTFRKCPPGGTVRSVSSSESKKSNIKCQKLWYTRSSVVKYDGAVTSRPCSTRRGKCERGMVGPLCNVPCPGSCWKTFICTQSGCSCAPGYCGTECDHQMYIRYTMSPEGNNQSGPKNGKPKGLARRGQFYQLTVTPGETGSVTLSWICPLPTNCEEFKLDIKIVNTTLRNKEKLMKQGSGSFSLQQSGANYSVDVTILCTATTYRFFVQEMNVQSDIRLFSQTYKVPGSPGFARGEKLKVNRTRSSIGLKIPSIVNDTQNTIVYVIVLGPSTCYVIQVPKYLREYLNMTNPYGGWVAATFTEPYDRPGYSSIGKDCTLDPHETYEIVVVVVDEVGKSAPAHVSVTVPPMANEYENHDQDNDKRDPGHGDEDKDKHDRRHEDTNKDDENHGENLTWLVIPLILVTCCLVAYIIYRKLFKKLKNIDAEIKLLPSAEHMDISATPIGTPGDWPFECHPHPIKLKQFESNVKKSVENGELEIQYMILPKGLMHPCRIGNLPENKSKNRYGNLIAYDHSRVVLGKGAHNSDSGYINANYIQGYFKEKAYIATQGPKSNTVEDFWRMIWQEDVRIIAMLVNVVEGKKKMCEQYWPEVGKKVTHGDLTILNLEQRVYADYTCRTLKLTACDKTELRQVKHLHYTGWPEQGIPMYSHSIVEYLNELRATPPGLGPIVVHCSAGTGRTGTIILCDIGLHHVAGEGTVNLFTEAKKMYSARANMLDNLQQYILAHLMPTQCLLLLPTKIPCSDVTMDQITALKKDLKVHMRRLAISSWKDKALRPSEPPKVFIASHLVKNRFPKLIPVERSLVSLKPYSKHDSSSEYISAVSVDGVKSKGQYLASQLPLPSTLSDFWRLVAEKEVELVVILQRPTPDSFACVDVVPREEKITPVPFITVENKTCTNYNKYFTTDQLLLTDTSGKRARIRTVTVLTCNDWKPTEDEKLPPPTVLVSLWSATERVSRPDVPTLVLCFDGVTGCGLYMALSFLLERMAVEHECDVILAVRAIRQSRSEFVYSLEQFEYLYDAALEFVENFRTYSNFS